MNTLNNANILNLVLNLGNLTDAAAPAVDIEAALSLPQGVDLEGLPPELLDPMAKAADALDFQQLMQQGLQAGEQQENPTQTDLPDAIRLAFSIPGKDEPGMEAVQPRALSDSLAHTLEEIPDNPGAAGDATEPASIMASPLILEEARVQPAHPTPGQPFSASLSVDAMERNPRQAAVPGGEPLPPQGQAASAATTETPLPQGVESFVLPKEPSDTAAGNLRNIVDAATADAGKLEVRKDSDEARLGPSTVEDRVARTDAGDADEAMEEDAFLADRNSAREERRFRLEARGPVSGELPRSEVLPASRVDAQTPPPVVAAAVNRPEGLDDKGMNDLPPEMKTLHLSPRAGESAWGREMGDRIGFLLHNNLKQAEIRLDPPHLGKLEIQLQVQDDKAMIHIQTQTAQTRDLLDASLMRLRDALQDAGYSQVDVNVSHREHSMAQGEGGNAGQGGSAGHSGPDVPDTEALPAGMSRHEIELTARMQGRIDYFA